MKRSVAAVILTALVVAGCGGSGSTTRDTAATAGMNVGGLADTSTAPTAAPATSAGTSTAGSPPSVNGIKPVASQTLATAEWQGMAIQARTMTPIRFYIYNGTKLQLVKPSRKTSFHLMIVLDDQHTNVPIPYATVWATITKNGKTIYDERQWPMISAYQGPHYGNNVTLPGPGSYKLSLLISPPVAARHVEYKNVWLKPHRVTVSFHWKPTK